ncbi:hypothetical protein GCM10011532_15700 [Christiangramia forsetii]|nr:hypothetical protein GCM10011532_15700 [Christiangramia forsetii]
MVLAVFVSCEEETLIFDSENGPEAVQFASRSFNVTVPSDDNATVTIPVNVTTTSAQERTFNVVASESSTALGSSYSIGTATIPANSYEGTVDVTLNPDDLAEGQSYSLVLELQPSTAGSAFNNVATINFNKEVICNDYKLVITTDQYAEETSWDITDSNGNVVASGPEVPYGPAASVDSRGKQYETDIFLEDGCYTFTIYDAYSDGQFDGVFEGGYSLTCSIVNAASGTGAFGASESTDFCVNQ